MPLLHDHFALTDTQVTYIPHPIIFVSKAMISTNKGTASKDFFSFFVLSCSVPACEWFMHREFREKLPDLFECSREKYILGFSPSELLKSLQPDVHNTYSINLIPTPFPYSSFHQLVLCTLYICHGLIVRIWVLNHPYPTPSPSRRLKQCINDALHNRCGQ